MCGRYTLTARAPDILRERFALCDDIPLEPRFNIAPGQEVLAVTTRRDGSPRAELLRWGLMPHWVEPSRTHRPLINARAETLAERPAFRAAFAERRCLIVADGFYEWQSRADGPKQPWWITREDRAPFAFAGIWASRQPSSDSPPLRTCAIVTTQANALVRDLHDRMPVILEARDEPRWLARGASSADLLALLRALPAERTARRPVSLAVNDVAHDAPDCIEPVTAPPDAPTLF
ncbi:MAG: SOS response-associated peptidase [Solirubrobacteraceae bacterium]|nr:SOS response-associated peptidase [Solirubrobacteraceae bacterium]